MVNWTLDFLISFVCCVLHELDAFVKHMCLACDLVAEDERGW